HRVYDGRRAPRHVDRPGSAVMGAAFLTGPIAADASGNATSLAEGFALGLVSAVLFGWGITWQKREAMRIAHVPGFFRAVVALVALAIAALLVSRRAARWTEFLVCSAAGVFYASTAMLTKALALSWGGSVLESLAYLASLTVLSVVAVSILQVAHRRSRAV